jgi:hypothetical protein
LSDLLAAAKHSFDHLMHALSNFVITLLVRVAIMVMVIARD